MKKKILTICFMSLVISIVIFSSVLANSGQSHDDCYYGCLHEIEQVVYVDGDYITIRSVTHEIESEQIVLVDGDYITILYSSTSYVTEDTMVDSPLTRDGSLNHALRCGGSLHVTHDDFHTFHANTGVCIQRTRITTTTCLRCWATASSVSALSGCGFAHS